MDVHSECFNPGSLSLSHSNASFWETEDSGYQTLTPGSLEFSEISNENIHPSLIRKNIRTGHKYNRSKNNVLCTHNDSCNVSPIIRRGVKRPYQEDADHSDTSSVPTPTTLIAGRIQRLKVNDKLNSSFSIPLVHTDCRDALTNDLNNFNDYPTTLSFPSTPVKRICRSTCKLSPTFKSSPLRAIDNVYCPPKRSAKKLNFAIHSLSCETQGLQAVISKPLSKVVRTLQFRPDQKVDIIKMLYLKVRCIPGIMRIFNYLSNEDIYNFSLVSRTWLEVCEFVDKEKKQEYEQYLNSVKENQENKEKCVSPKTNNSNHNRALKEINNILNTQTIKNSPISPPGTPRTNKFKRFTKSASLDARVQVSCVRCCQPAKVNEETRGEEWAECVSTSCAYQFCRFCNCDRHPGKKCFQYDLDGPSPSKRKKNSCVVGTRKSRKNLRRLL